MSKLDNGGVGEEGGGGKGIKEFFGRLIRGKKSPSPRSEGRRLKKLQHVPSEPMLSPTLCSKRYDDDGDGDYADADAEAEMEKKKQTTSVPVVNLSASTPNSPIRARSGSVGSRRVSGGAEIPFLDLTPIDKQRQHEVAMKIVPIPLSPQDVASGKEAEPPMPESPLSSTQSSPTTGDRSFHAYATSSSSSSSRQGWRHDSGLSSIGSSSNMGVRLDGSDLASDRSRVFSEDDDDDDCVTFVVGSESEEYLVKVVAPQLKDVLVEEGSFIPLTKGRKKKKWQKKKKKKSSLKKIVRVSSRPKLDMPPMLYELMTLTLDPKHPCPSIENTDEAVRTIVQKLKAGPMASDCQGFIYMYRSQVDGEKSMYRKICRAENIPDCHQDGDVVLIRSWKVKRGRFAETLIHWMLDRVRVYRAPVYRYYTNGQFKYLSRNKNTEQYVQDTVYCEYAEKGWLPKKFDAESKEIEWFYTGESVMMDVIRACVTDINLHWKAEQWLHMFKEIPDEQEEEEEWNTSEKKMTGKASPKKM